jgi:hypothetical protein
MDKKVIIITKYFVPHKVVDSDSVYIMVAKLKQLDINLQIHIVTTSSTYKSEVLDDGKYDKNVLTDITVHTIKPVQTQSKSSVRVFLSNLLEGYRLVRTAKQIGIKNILSLTNPPLIAMWCSLLLKKRNFFYWSFDLYPDALAAERILSANGALYERFHRLTYLNAPNALIALGDYQYKYLCEKFGRSISKIILPCGVHNDTNDTHAVVPQWAQTDAVILGYIGNIGRAHSLSFLKNVILAIKSKSNFRLVLSVYGYYSKQILEYVKEIDADNIMLVDFIEKRYLGLIDINLVSLKRSWTNISVPSKAVSAVCSGSPLWFCGADNSDTWDMFKQCSYKSTEELADIEIVINNISKADLKEKKAKTKLIKSNLIDKENLAYSQIIEQII